jgi:purine-binding chemotaxis protein CheW
MGPSVTANATSNYVTVGVGDEIFAVDVAIVREILAYRTVVHLPNAPPFLVGVIDVRGSTVPVIALRLKLGLPAASITDDTRILVLEIDVEGRQLVVGLLADRVFEVAEFEIDGLEAAPDVGVRWKSEYIRGIGRLRGNLVIIFDMEHLLSNEDVASRQAGP